MLDDDSVPMYISISETEVAENTTRIGTVSAVDVSGSAPSFALDVSEDAELFQIDSQSGALSFLSPQNFESLNDEDGNNIYKVSVEVTGLEGSATQSFEITVHNVDDGSAVDFRIIYSLAADGSDDGKDWSGNGVVNILYYVFGLGDPMDAEIDRSRLPVLTSVGDTMTYSYRYAFPIEGYRLNVLTSTDLTSWDSSDILIGTEEAPIDTTAEEDGDGYVKLSVTYPTTNTARFFTVEITSAE